MLADHIFAAPESELVSVPRFPLFLCIRAFLSEPGSLRDMSEKVSFLFIK